MSMTESDLTKLLQVQLCIQIAITNLLEGQKQIVDLIMSMFRNKQGKNQRISIKGCDVKVKRLRLPEHCLSKKKIKKK